jgi:hypothetical protein
MGMRRTNELFQTHLEEASKLLTLDKEIVNRYRVCHWYSADIVTCCMSVVVLALVVYLVFAALVQMGGIRMFVSVLLSVAALVVDSRANPVILPVLLVLAAPFVLVTLMLVAAALLHISIAVTVV